MGRLSYHVRTVRTMAFSTRNVFETLFLKTDTGETGSLMLSVFKLSVLHTVANLTEKNEPQN